MRECYANEDFNFLVCCRQNMSGPGSSLIARGHPPPSDQLTKQPIIIILSSGSTWWYQIITWSQLITYGSHSINNHLGAPWLHATATKTNSHISQNWCNSEVMMTRWYDDMTKGESECSCAETDCRLLRIELSPDRDQLNGASQTFATIKNANRLTLVSLSPWTALNCKLWGKYWHLASHLLSPGLFVGKIQASLTRTFLSVKLPWNHNL